MKLRGQVWLLEMPELIPHPVVLLTRDPVCDAIERPTVALITSEIRGLESEVTLDGSDGAMHECCVSLDNVFNVEHYYLTQYLYDLGPARLQEICEALHAAMGCY